MESIAAPAADYANSSGKLGANLAQLLINKWFGLASLAIPLFLAIAGIKLLKIAEFRIVRWFICCSFLMIWCSIFLQWMLAGIMKNSFIIPGGMHGKAILEWLHGNVGAPGIILILMLSMLLFCIYLTRQTIEWIRNRLTFFRNRKETTSEVDDTPDNSESNINSSEQFVNTQTSVTNSVEQTVTDDFNVDNNIDDEDDENDPAPYIITVIQKGNRKGNDPFVIKIGLVICIYNNSLDRSGHFDLLKYVPWCGDYGMPGKVGKRSKTQINIIKQRIISMGNNSLSRDLIRNESHIRLLNSLWYIFRFLQEISLFFILIQLYLVLSYMFHIVVDNGGISITISLVEVEKYCSPVPLIVFVIAFFAVWVLKRNIVKCFHYVRTRELVMVLNAAETVRRASTNKKDLLFFHGMRKCNKEFIKTFCRGCPNETLCGR